MNIGVDIGGSKILVVAGDENQQIVRSQKVATPATGAQGVAEIIHLIEQVAAGETIDAIGVAAPGPLNRVTGTLFETPSPNMGWEPTKIVELLKNHFGVSVALENDANLAALSEATVGAAVDKRYVLYVTVSTGIGTGMVFDGEVYHGAHDSEGGHMIIPAENKGEEFEEAAAGPAMKRRFGKFGYEITDPATWDAYAKDLAIGLHNMITLISPDVVVIGGGVGVHFEKFHTALNQHLAELKPEYPTPPVVPAKNIETAVAIGALILADRLG